jgi:hypothetical protein
VFDIRQPLGFAVHVRARQIQLIKLTVFGAGLDQLMMLRKAGAVVWLLAITTNIVADRGDLICMMRLSQCNALAYY